MYQITDTEKTKIDEACKAAEKFCKLYYETFDKQRHKIGMFYLEDASVVWNGNEVKGNNAITQFYESLPESSVDVISLDAQPIFGIETGNHPSLLIQVSGRTAFSKKPYSSFCQAFQLIVKEDTGTWKIFSDTFRVFK